MRKLFGRVCAIATAAVMLAGTAMAQLPVSVYASDDNRRWLRKWELDGILEIPWTDIPDLPLMRHSGSM